MVDPHQVTLAINAGGRGLRLGGRAKGLLELGGRTVIDRLLELRSEVAEVVLIANDAAPYARWKLRTVADEVPAKGAPGGVVTAMRAAPTPWVLVVACDMPFVTVEAVQRLRALASPEAEVVCFTRDGQLEPLLALYRTALHDEWKQALAANPSLKALVGQRRLICVEAPDPHLLDSLNTPEDLARHS